jgi:HK97 family phage prohead protease
MDYKIYKSEIKADDSDGMTFEGYASVFGNKDSWGDVMEPGAFKKTIAENKKRIKVLAMHDFYSVIGIPKTLEEDTKGLYFNAKISDTQLGRDIFTLIKDKAITEMSIGYNALKYEINRDENSKDYGIRYLKEVRLWEISPVTWGANEKAKIKALNIYDNYDKLESRLNDIETLIKKEAGLIHFRKNEPSSNDLNDPDMIQSLIDRINKYK